MTESDSATEFPEIGPWRWRNLRDVGVAVEFWPIRWTRPMIDRDDDEYGGHIRFECGPVAFVIHYNNGAGLRWFWRK